MHPEKIFIDTTAFCALIDSADQYHQCAKMLWPSLLEKNVALLTSSYVVAETMNRIQDLLGYEAADLWYKAVLGVVDVKWADEWQHDLGYELWMSLGRLGFSFVDCVSQIMMNRHQVKKAFCFKPNFADQGITVVP
ncbi:putative PilT domain protein [Desulfosarcina variabilis str. Montpellier]|uniref:type II toxin-antitoxin system VapC family toxin n=1 Tax=Desulfosarcina variabilis TaxID=2300 RepID=UPI003AFB0BC0